MSNYKLILEPGRASKNYWSDLIRFKELFYILSWRDLKVRYKQTVLGVAWSVVRPLLTMIVFTVVFSKAAGLKADDPSVPYSLFVLAGILPWQFFSNALSEASGSLIGNANLISKVYFPRMIIPASAVITSMVDFAITFGLMLLMFVYFQYIPSVRIFFLPLFILLAFFLCFWCRSVFHRLECQIPRFSLHHTFCCSVWFIHHARRFWDTNLADQNVAVF